MTVAVMKTKAEQALTELFEASSDKLPGSTAVTAARRDAIGKFCVSGLPHRRIEEWKYTDLRNTLKDVPARPARDDSGVTIADVIVALGPLAQVDSFRLTFVNGSYRADLSDFAGEKGIEVSPLAGALSAAPDKVAEALTSVGAHDDAILTLNTAFMTDGAVVRIAPGATPSKPLLLVFLRAGQEGRFTAVRNVILAGEASVATMIEAHVGVPGASKEGQMNALTRLTVAKGARIDHIKVAADFGKSVHLSNWDVTLEADATYHGFQYTVGQSLARNQVAVRYDGEGGKLDLSGAFLAREHEHVDTTLVVDHAVPHCISRELFKGVLDNAARGIFQGKIIVQPDAQKTDGKQMAQVLMLSPNSEFDSKPELEIYADDVVCGHGTTTAELDDDLLFYCMSRGIPKNAARMLMIELFVGEALEKVEHEGVRQALEQMAHDWLKASTSA